MLISLGIDTGGTYTDAALVEQATGKVLAAAKALTTRHDLSVGIAQAITTVFMTETKENPPGPGDVNMVGLSTTLATNAIAEGYGARVCLLLIGYDQELMTKQGFHRELATDDIVYLEGGHDLQGNEITPLDIDGAQQAILARRDEVEAFAISGYFGTRNATHELRLRRLVEDLTGLPVTCGSELTTRLNAVRRAATVVLNARLIPLLRDLITKVRQTLNRLEITAPLMVVKGDGSLVRAEWAIQRPVETILSGPAASAIGALSLSGQRDVWVVDMGGTTTDIVALHDGRLRINPEGAGVGGRRTMVEAVDVHTVGLGGDSHVTIDSEGQLTIGPQRVIPLCLLASRFPAVEERLRHQMLNQLRESGAGQFAIPWRRPSHGLSKEDMELLSRMETGPLALCGEGTREDWLLYRRVERLEKMCIVQRAAFTPTDALHVLGRLNQWNTPASRLGAQLLALKAQSSAEAIAQKVVRGMSERVAREIVSKILGDEIAPPDWQKELTATSLLQRAFSGQGDTDLACELRLLRPLVALGAPVEAYMPGVAERLRTELIIPPHAEVANAVGAVTGSVVQRINVLISPLDGGSKFRLHLPNGVRDFETLEEAILHAQQVVPPSLEALAQEAGAAQVEIRMSRKDRGVKLNLGWIQQIHLDTQLIFTAIGRLTPAGR